MKSKFLVYLTALTSIALWGLSYIWCDRILALGIPVEYFLPFRIFIAGVLLLAVNLIFRISIKVRKSDWVTFLLLALCEPFIYHLCETSGVQLVSGSLASVVIATIPLFVPFGMWVAYRQRITPQLIVGVVLSLGGVFILIAGGESLQGNAKGLLFLAGAVVIAVVYTLLLVKIVGHYRPLTITTWQNLIGLIYFLPLVLAFDGSQLPLLSYSPKMLLILLTLGICCSTLAYAFYNRGVRVLGASEACIFNNAIPVFSLIAAILIGQETFSWLKVLGIVIVIAGVILAQFEPKHR